MPATQLVTALGPSKRYGAKFSMITTSRSAKTPEMSASSSVEMKRATRWARSSIAASGPGASAAPAVFITRTPTRNTSEVRMRRQLHAARTVSIRRHEGVALPEGSRCPDAHERSAVQIAEQMNWIDHLAVHFHPSHVIRARGPAEQALNLLRIARDLAGRQRQVHVLFLPHVRCVER